MSQLSSPARAVQLLLKLVCLISLTLICIAIRAQGVEPGQIQKKPTAVKFDEYGNIPFDDEKARLDNFAIELQSDPTSQGFILAYGLYEGQAQARANRVKEYLGFARGIDSARVVTVDGGCMPDFQVELWIVPNGATPPAMSKENAVWPCPIRRGRAMARRAMAIGAVVSTEVPDFPWPPPRASATASIPRLLVENPGSNTVLQDVATRLERALNQAGYGEMSWYQVPEGFAMVSRLEQFNDDGTPLAGDDRFSAELARPRRTLKALLSDLFIAREGHYRVIAFVVTSIPIQQSTEQLTRARAMDLVSSGADRLPENIRSQLFSVNHRCTALIYEFIQRTPDHAAELITPSRLDGTTHLRRSGILAALEIR